ncbi:MAG: PadR family transcriptional regulator [Candidatus Viridilinea halotolerans]|uniref:PadR family transcriptional regulator n=1 Tax=Candidatus Viridilinea halotolerans TaxID=2491704 RepID=A0A426U6C8_9CHLR|nr:MAG: PadR family transcriptional regulator [Candidatus Viridilinea halotolerans]
MDRHLLLLGLLRHQEMHGYQINEFIDQQMDFCVDLKRSTAYYILDKLCRDGYVRLEIERAGNRPERRVYHITPAGEAHFQALLRENLATYRPPVYVEDVGTIFQSQLPPDELAELLRSRRDQIIAHQAQLELLRSKLPPNHDAVIEHHLLHIAVELTWVDRLLAAMV